MWVVPILFNLISGFQKSSSNFCWRRISSSYSTIVLLKATNISSAAAANRSLTNTFKYSNEDIVCSRCNTGRNLIFCYQITSLQSLNTSVSLTSVRCHELYFRQKTNGGIFVPLASEVVLFLRNAKQQKQTTKSHILQDYIYICMYVYRIPCFYAIQRLNASEGKSHNFIYILALLFSQGLLNCSMVDINEGL